MVGMESLEFECIGPNSPLKNLVVRLLENGFSVAKQFSSELNSPFLKVNKEIFDGQSYICPIFLILQEQGDGSLKSTIFTYNEEVVEIMSFNIDKEMGYEYILDYIYSKLNSPKHFICPGLKETNVINLSLKTNEIYIEKFGSSIIYRSRDCNRLTTTSDVDICSNCSSWIHKKLSCSNNRKPQNLLKVEPLLQQLQEQRNIKEEIIVNDAGEGDVLIHHGLFKPDQVQDPLTNNYVDEEEEAIRMMDRRCPSCNENFRTHQPLYRHMQECIPEHEFFACHHCDYIYPSMIRLKRHISLKHEGISECPVDDCPKSFKIPLGKIMRSHLETVHDLDPDNLPEDMKKKLNSIGDKYVQRYDGRRTYPCSVVGCQFVGKDVTSLRYHQPVHTGETMFCCTTCGKKFKYKKEFLLCEKKHKGDYDHVCTSCDKRFLTKKKLDSHLRVHTGEKPYSCPACTFRSARKDNLNTHAKRVHGIGLRELERQLSEEQDKLSSEVEESAQLFNIPILS